LNRGCGGVLLTNDRHQLDIVQTTCFSVRYRIFERFELSLRSRAIYLDGGNGIEATFLISGHDFV
jgi:hypothetical protein